MAALTDDAKWADVGPAFHGDLSGSEPSPFPDPSMPEEEPFKVIPAPAHVSNELWQTSFYDASSHAPASVFVQRPAGPCSIESGHVIDGDWPESRIWKQV